MLGQNVNAYRGLGPDGADWSLARLLQRLASFPEIERLRYTTSHPRDMDDDLIALHGDEPKLMPYLHLPFQAGSDSILNAMNRKHSADDYAALVDRIRAARPDIALSTDIIVGFPGETDADFEQTLALVRRIGFARAFSFKYSARPGTPAASLPGQVPDNGPGAALRLAKPARRRSEGLRRGNRRAEAPGAVRADRAGNQDRSPGVHPISRPCMGRARRTDRPDRGG